LTIGAWFGRNRLLKIQIGSVCTFGGAVNVVTMISSNDSPNASTAPATREARIWGKVTRRNVVQLVAPRSIDASSNDMPTRRSRASALLYTTTMQNVAWPMRIDRNVSPPM